jgi:hypothetical protein
LFQSLPVHILTKSDVPDNGSALMELAVDIARQVRESFTPGPTQLSTSVD